MSLKLTELREKIQQLKHNEGSSFLKKEEVRGYSIALVMMADLLSCILVGLGLGLFFQKFFDTPSLLTAGFTLLGGIAGLYSIIRFAMRQDRK